MGLYIDEPRMQIREERTAWTAAVLKKKRETLRIERPSPERTSSMKPRMR